MTITRQPVDGEVRTRAGGRTRSGGDRSSHRFATAFDIECCVIGAKLEEHQQTRGRKTIVSCRTLLLFLFIGLSIPLSAFGQSIPTSFEVSPDTVYQVGWPSCYMVTVGNGENMTIDVLYSYEYGEPQEFPEWLSLDGWGQGTVCIDANTVAGHYDFIGVGNNQEWWWGYTPVNASLDVIPPPPVISALSADCENRDCIRIVGARFQQDSYLHVYSADWTTYQTYWGPSWSYSPGMYVSAEGTIITLQITDPTLLSSFGNAGVHVLVANSNGLSSGWVGTQSPPPVISNGGSNCNDDYCIWLAGSFPLNAIVDFRIPGQPDVIPNAYSDLNVTESSISLRLNPSVRHDFDVSGLNAWVVNPPLANWSNGYYIPPVDRAIIGNVDGVVLSGLQYYVIGWACAKTYEGSIAVHVYVGGPYGTGIFAFSGTANFGSEPALAAACHSAGFAYRFSLPIPHAITQSYGNQPIYVHGISPYGLANSLIGNSGTFPVPAVDRSVTGFISGVVVENQQYYLKGWACARTYSGSIGVHVYAGGPAGSGTFATSTTANLSSNPTTTSTCNTGGTNYGFSVALPLALRQQFSGQPIYAHGISPFGLANSLLDNSGGQTFPPPVATSSREYIYLGDRLLAVETTNLP